MRAKRGACLLLVCAVLTGAALWGQDSGLRSITRVWVKPDRIAEYEEVQKQLSAAWVKGGGQYRIVWRVAVGATNEFMIVTPMNKYADRDVPSPMTKGIDPGPLASLGARSSACVERTVSTIERFRDDLSVTGDEGVSPLLRLTRTRVRPGQTAAYVASTKELIAAYKKAGVKGVRTRQVEWGGNRSEFATSTRLETWAQLDEPSPAAKAMGEDAYNKWVDRRMALVSSTEFTVLRYRPELSQTAPASR